MIQYADDTAIQLDGSEKSLKRDMLDMLHQFFKFSNLKPNIEKTTATGKCCYWQNLELTLTRRDFDLSVIYQ